MLHKSHFLKCAFYAEPLQKIHILSGTRYRYIVVGIAVGI